MRDRRGLTLGKSHEYPTGASEPENFVDDTPGEGSQPGVLLGDQIMKYVKELSPSLIENFEAKSLRAASYQLRLGEEYYCNGTYAKLTVDSPDLVIQPHGIVIVTTFEVLHMPRYLIGRWNLRLQLVYEGILWSGAAQVDPGYHGKLLCPLYNLSDRPVKLVLQQGVFNLDFERTTKYTQASEQYRFGVGSETHGQNLTEPRAKSLRQLAHLPQHEEYTLVSGVERLRDDLKKGKDEIERVASRAEESRVKLEDRIVDFEGIMFLVISIVFAGLALSGFAPLLAKENVVSNDIFYWLSMFASGIAVFLSLFTLIWVKRRLKPAQITEIQPTAPKAAG
jgi:deoxycytidine triphosphate deaminase